MEFLIFLDFVAMGQSVRIQWKRLAGMATEGWCLVQMQCDWLAKRPPKNKEYFLARGQYRPAKQVASERRHFLCWSGAFTSVCRPEC